MTSFSNYSSQEGQEAHENGARQLGVAASNEQSAAKEAPLKKKTFSKKQKVQLSVGVLALALLAGGAALVYGKKGTYSALSAEMQQRVASLPAATAPEPPVAQPSPAVSEQTPQQQAQQPADQPAVTEPAAMAQDAQAAPATSQAAQAEVPGYLQGGAVPQAMPPTSVAAAPAQPVVNHAQAAPAQVSVQSQPQGQVATPAQVTSTPTAPVQPKLVESGPGAGLPVHIVKPSLADGTETKLRMVIEGMRADLDKIAAESAEYSKQIAAKKTELEKLNAKLAETRRDLNNFDKQADAAQRELDRAEERRLEAERKARAAAEKQAAAAALAEAIAAEKRAEAAAAEAKRQRAALAAAAAGHKPAADLPAPAKAPAAAMPAGAKSVAEYLENNKPAKPAAPAAMKPVERPVVAGILSDGVVMPNGDVVEVGKRSMRLGGRLTGVLPASGAIEVEGVVRYVTIAN